MTDKKVWLRVTKIGEDKELDIVNIKLPDDRHHILVRSNEVREDTVADTEEISDADRLVRICITTAAVGITAVIVSSTLRWVWRML